jgi:hypothetical protein
MNKKAWYYGPNKIKYTPCPPVHYEPCIEKPVRKFTPTDYSNVTFNRPKTAPSYNFKPWREANAMSHELFKWHDRNATII